jgi:hypothetical protein
VLRCATLLSQDTEGHYGTRYGRVTPEGRPTNGLPSFDDRLGFAAPMIRDEVQCHHVTASKKAQRLLLSQLATEKALRGSETTTAILGEYIAKQMAPGRSDLRFCPVFSQRGVPDGHRPSPPPAWLMRRARRYLPVYSAPRAEAKGLVSPYRRHIS